MSSSDSIETSAPTIDQAIGQALAQLGAEQDDVTIEVLSTPRSGLLGLGVRPARVRVTRRAPAGARSGVMSPPPAPPLRATPPEMRRADTRPQPRRESDQAPPRRDDADLAQRAPGTPTDYDRREAAPEPRDQAPPEMRREAPQELRREAPREVREQAPPRRPERSGFVDQDRSDLPNQERSDAPRQERSEPSRQDRGDLARPDRNDPSRQRPRGQGRTSSDAPAPEDRRSPEDRRAPSRTAPGGPARQPRGAPSANDRNAPPAGEARGRGEPPRRERDEVQGGERGDTSPQGRGELQAHEPDETSPDERDSRARRDLGDRGDDQRGNGRAGGPPRRRRGRGRGGATPAGPTDGERGGRRPAEAQSPPHDQEHDEERDPFASVDEPGNDPRLIADLQEQAREATIFLERILALMGEQATIERAESDDPETLELNIKGDGSGILIGRHGQTLDAIEYMVNRLLARKVKDAAPISIDTESYRARRRRLLQRLALSKGEQAKREHVVVIVDPMPPRDRRIVHLALKDDPMIATRSTGDGFMRPIEIVPVVERRDPNDRGNENRGRGRTRDLDRDKAPLGEQGGFKHGQKRIV